MSLKCLEKSFLKETEKTEVLKRLHTVLLEVNKENRFLLQKE